MTAQTALELKEILFLAYDGFADKRYKNLDRDAPFMIDDRGPGDYDARGNLFLWFCLMFATVVSGQEVRLLLRGGLPESDEVSLWLDHMGAVKRHGGVELKITPHNLDDLLELAGRISKIIKATYSVKAYKYVVPRVARSLRRFHQVLADAWA